MSSNFRNPVFLLISSFLTLSFHVIPSSLRWNLWSDSGSRRYSSVMMWQESLQGTATQSILADILC